MTPVQCSVHTRLNAVTLPSLHAMHCPQRNGLTPSSHPHPPSIQRDTLTDTSKGDENAAPRTSGRCRCGRRDVVAVTHRCSQRVRSLTGRNTSTSGPPGTTQAMSTSGPQAAMRRILPLAAALCVFTVVSASSDASIDAAVVEEVTDSGTSDSAAGDGTACYKYGSRCRVGGVILF